MFNSSKVNGMSKETIKRALTEGLAKNNLLASRDNIGKISKRPVSQMSQAKNRPAFSKSQSLQTSVLSRPGSVCSKKATSPKKEAVVYQPQVIPIQKVTPKKPVMQDDQSKTSTRSIHTTGNKIMSKNSIMQSEYFIGQQTSVGKPAQASLEKKPRPSGASIKSKAGKIESESNKNFSTGIAGNNYRAVTSYAHLFKQSRHNTPSITSKSQFNRTTERMREPVPTGGNSSRKKKVDPKYRTFFNAFQKKNITKNAKTAGNKQSTIGSLKSLPNQSSDERPSYNSKRSAFDQLTGSKNSLQNDAIRKDLLEMNQLIGKLRIVTGARPPGRFTAEPLSATSHLNQAPPATPLDSPRPARPATGHAEAGLDQVYRDLIKKTNALYQEIYND